MAIALVGHTAEGHGSMREIKPLNRRAQNDFAKRNKTFIHRDPLGSSGLVELADRTCNGFVVNCSLKQGNHSDSLVIPADNRWENLRILWQSIALIKGCLLQAITGTIGAVAKFAQGS